MLTAAWTIRFPVLQQLAPYQAVADTLEQIVEGLEEDDREGGEGMDHSGGSGSGSTMDDGVKVVDCCSGAGGPMPAIEKRIK